METIDLIKEMLTDLEAWADAFPDCSETTKIIEHAQRFLEESPIKTCDIELAVTKTCDTELAVTKTCDTELAVTKTCDTELAIKLREKIREALMTAVYDMFSHALVDCFDKVYTDWSYESALSLMNILVPEIAKEAK